MQQATSSRFVPVFLLSAALAAPGAALAHGGGGHGSNGDSSNNPFTGDSYAYFHGGRNLGSEAMILPGRQYGPPPGGIQLYPWPGRAQASAPAAAAPRAAPAVQRSAPAADTDGDRATHEFRPTQTPPPASSSATAQP